MTATKAHRHSAILDLVNRGSVHTQQEIAAALARRGMRTTQATISRDIQELGLLRSGGGYRSSTALVRELVLSVELVEPVAILALVVVFPSGSHPASLGRFDLGHGEENPLENLRAFC